MRLLPLLFTASVFAFVASEELIHQRTKPAHGYWGSGWWHSLSTRISHYGERITTTHAPAKAGFYSLPLPVQATIEKNIPEKIATTLPPTDTIEDTVTTILPETTPFFEIPTTREIEEPETETLPPTTTSSEPLDTTTVKTDSPHLDHSVQARWMLLDPVNCPFELDGNLSSLTEPLFWPETPAGQFAFPNRPCYSSELLPVQRECKLVRGDAVWSKPNGTCDSKANSRTTSLLYEFTKKDSVSPDNVVKVTKKMAGILDTGKAPSETDVMLVDNILNQITKHAHHLKADSLRDVVSVLDKVSISSQVNNFNARSMQSATNSILRSVDEILSKVQLGRGGIASAKANKTSLLAADLEESEMKGVRVYNSEVVPLLNDFPQSETSANFLKISSGRASFVLLDNEENLFKINNENLTLNSKVLGVSLNGQHPWTQHGEPIVRLKFKPTKPSEGMEVKCAYWDIYNGEWKTDGCTYVGKEGDLDVCECNHLTHFGEIIGVSGDNKILDVISIVGCSLSLIGLLGIAATAVMFENWRSRLGNKILLHLSTAIGLTMAAFLSIALDAGSASDASCITLGVLLHYSILASFCWMLISALLQFLRFVSVLSARPPHFLLKGVLFGWVLPTIPVIVLLSMGPSKSYPRTNSTSGFCYPVELSLIFGVIIPVACAVIGNLLVFCLIVYRVSCGRPKNLTVSTMAERRVMALRQLRMSVLLFFLLGLTWIFGLLAMVAPFLTPWRVTFSYFFCITATLQGLALFIFFIVWEKKTRRMWMTALPERFAPSRPSRPATTSTAFSESSSRSSSKVRDERAPLRQKAAEQDMVKRTFGTNKSVSKQ